MARNLDQIVQEHLGSLQLAVCQLRAENEALKAENEALKAKLGPDQSPALKLVPEPKAEVH